MNPPEHSNDEENRQEEEDYNTFTYKFEQQIIDAWKPVPYSKNNVILYSFLSISFNKLAAASVAIGLVLILTAENSQQIEEIYQNGDQPQNTGNNITVDFTLDDTLKAPVYLYYGLNNFYQNHRRYIKFFSTGQMNGNEVDEPTALADCGGHAHLNSEIGATVSITGAALNPNDVAYPCGERAKSYLKIKKEIDTIELLNGTTPITLDRTGVAWPDDKRAYSNSGNPQKQAIDNQDEAWLVWYRPSPKNYFYKLHSIIRQDLPQGTYTFKVTDNFDASFGTKSFLLGKSNYMGNRDYFLGIAFLVLGGGCLIVLLFFIAKCVTEMRGKPKRSD